MLIHPKNEQARIIGQIQGCYNNVSALIRPAINQIEFEKAVKEDKISFFFDDVIKAYATDTLKKVEGEADQIKKSKILTQAKNQLTPLEKINVVFDNVVKSMHVDVIDTTTNTYKDNAINRLLDRVDEVAVGRKEIEKSEDDDIFKAEGSRGGKVIGHDSKGKPIYEDKNDPHQHSGINTHEAGSGYDKERTTKKRIKELSDEDLKKFKEHHEKHEKNYKESSDKYFKENKSKLEERDPKTHQTSNKKAWDGYNEHLEGHQSHGNAKDFAKDEEQRRKDGGEHDKQVKKDNRRDSEASMY